MGALIESKVKTVRSQHGRPVGALALCVAALALVLILTVVGAAEAEPPTLPQSQPLEAPAASAATTVTYVAAGADLQAALDAAMPGDVLELEAGAVFSGNFVLPRKPLSEEWIYVRSSAATTSLVPPGTRVGPDSSRNMATLEASSGTVLGAAAGARQYVLTGLEIRPATQSATAVNALVWLGGEGWPVQEQPAEIIIERSYLHGDPQLGMRRGVVLNAGATTIRDSYLADFMTTSSDSQAVVGWSGPGPYRIHNNYLEAAGENVMFGGADPYVRELVPSDITITGNHFYKPPAWNPADPSFAGTQWQVKNLLELKNARRVLISGNVLENNWMGAQNGFAILFTVRNQDNTAPWSVVEDVTFSDNLIRNVANGFNLLGYDDNYRSQQTKRIHIYNNLITGLGEGGQGTLLQMLDGTAGVQVQQNTVMNRGNLMMAEGRSHVGFVFSSNIAMHGEYGMIGTGTASVQDTLARYFTEPELRGNVIVGAAPNQYPEDNTTVRNVAALDFVDVNAGNFRLSERSRFSAARSAGASGADIDRLCNALSSVDRHMFCAAPVAP